MAQLATEAGQNLKFYSNPEHQQDRWVVHRIFGAKRNGFFVDAGAGDGILDSNTFALESQLGWQGICIEANPENYEKIKQNRTCAIEPVALWDETTELTFTVNLNVSGTSGVLDEMNKPNRDRYYPEGVQCQELNVQAMPLADLLRKHNAPKFIDYLSMDIEGAEYRALQDFPFDQYMFGCMTIEKGSAKLLDLRQLLLNQGYQLVNVTGVDDFWVHPSVEYHLPLNERLELTTRKWVQTIRSVMRGEG